MKVLLVTTSYPDANAGEAPAGNFVVHFARCLIKSRTPTTVVAPAAADRNQAVTEQRQLHLTEGSNFFRGLALIDLIEAMLKRAFGDSAVAVRINAAGQGDYFQVHYDVSQVTASDIKHFMDRAVYQRFGLEPENKFVDVYPGGPAVGVGLDRLREMGEVTAGIRRGAGLVPSRLAEAPDAE